MPTITVSVQEKKDTLNKITLLLSGKLLSLSFYGSSYDTPGSQSKTVGTTCAGDEG